MKIALLAGGIVALALILAFATKALAGRRALALDQRAREERQLGAANKKDRRNERRRTAKKILDPLGIF